MPDKTKAIELLNKIMELKLAGVVRYTHYSLMVYGFNRIPIISWRCKQADEGLDAESLGDLKHTLKQLTHLMQKTQGLHAGYALSAGTEPR